METIIMFDDTIKGRIIMCEILKNLQGKKASELLDIYSMNEQTPIKIEKLLEDIGIDLLEADFASIEEDVGYKKGEVLGATLILGEDVTIFYREGSTKNRLRFTIAHELAHCCLHTAELKETNIQLRQNTSSEEIKEKEANVFAGELLIPEINLLKYYRELLVPSLKTLADIFQVSTSVMAARLDWLKLPYYKDAEVNEG